MQEYNQIPDNDFGPALPSDNSADPMDIDSLSVGEHATSLQEMQPQPTGPQAPPAPSVVEGGMGETTLPDQSMTYIERDFSLDGLYQYLGVEPGSTLKVRVPVHHMAGGASTVYPNEISIELQVPWPAVPEHIATGHPGHGSMLQHSVSNEDVDIVMANGTDNGPDVDNNTVMDNDVDMDHDDDMDHGVHMDINMDEGMDNMDMNID